MFIIRKFKTNLFNYKPLYIFINIFHYNFSRIKVSEKSALSYAFCKSFLMSGLENQMNSLIYYILFQFTYMKKIQLLVDMWLEKGRLFNSPLKFGYSSLILCQHLTSGSFLKLQGDV